MFKSLGSSGSTLVNTRKSKVRKAFLIKINGKYQKDLSLGLQSSLFVEPQFSHLKNGVWHFIYFGVQFENEKNV